ncbi:hypothetical protein Dimus_016991 [Dionaea muscipula]
MGVLRESWCFCNGGGKSEKLKSSIFSSKSSTMARVTASVASTSSSRGEGEVSGTGFLIHRDLLLTTHGNLPSVAAAESAEIRLQNGLAATLVPHRFFITSSVLDLSIVGLDYVDGGDTNSQGLQPHFLKTYSKLNLDLGSVVYLLGFMGNRDLTMGEGKVVIATDNLIKLSTDGAVWSPGSAGFDAHGNLAFMVCYPMKLATSPNTKSSSTSSSSTSSWKKDLPMQFGIPMPTICDWLNQHWEGSLDELSKPKLPLMKLVSATHRSEHSCASFSMRQVFKPTDQPDVDQTPSSSQTVTKPWEPPGPSSPAPLVAAANVQGIQKVAREREPRSGSHVQGIPTPEIYESPKVTAVPVRRRRESTLVHLLDINFPPRIDKAAGITPQTANDHLLLPSSDKNSVMESSSRGPHRKEQEAEDREVDKLASVGPNEEDVESTGSVDVGRSEVHSSSSPVAAAASSMVRDGQISEVETMYSAETAESRNYTSPREREREREGKLQPVGRSQSCVNYNRWAVHKYPVAARKSSMEKQRSFTQPRGMYSLGATSHRSNDYFSPTVSSIMKKRNGSMEPPSRYRQAAVHSSPRWMF